MSLSIAKHLRHREEAFLILELLVATLVGAVLLAGVAATALHTMKSYRDSLLRSTARENAQLVLDAVVFDLRMAGAGMPLSQQYFAIGDVALGDAPLPILTGAGADSVTLRLNERGRQTVLAVDFTPSSIALEMETLTAADFANGDTVYLSNLNVGGGDGLSATVASVSGETLTISDSFLTAPDAEFLAGSSLHRVSEVIYASADDWSGITREFESETVTMAQNSRLTLDYQAADGTSLTVPLSSDDIRDSLSRIDVQVEIRSPRQLSNGTTYTATAKQRVVIRNLFLQRL